MPAPPLPPARGCPLQTCLACLATDVRMFDLELYNLSKSYAALVGYQCEDGMPDMLCYECARKLNKFKAFRALSRRAYSILRGLLEEYDEITESKIKEIDRKETNLETALTCCYLKPLHIDPHIEDIKENPLENIHKVFLDGDAEEFNASKELKCEVFKNKDTEDNTDSKEDLKIEFKFEDDDEPMDGVECYVRELSPPIVKERREKKSVRSKKKLSKMDKKQERRKTRSGKVEKRKVKKEMVKSEVNKIVTRKRKLKMDADSDDGNEKDSETRPATKTKPTRPKLKGRQHTTYSTEYYEDIATVTVMSEEEQREFFKLREHSSKYTEAPYRCVDCYLGFTYVQAYDAHRLKHDPIAGDEICNICKIRLKNRRLLLKHISQNHKTKFACKKCEFVCSKSQGARLHASTHVEATYYCELCDIKFEQLKTYQKHIYLKHPKVTPCALCGATFLGQGARNRHRARVHCDVTEPNGESEVGCEACGVVFRSQEAYVVHRTTYPGHDTEHGLIACEFCDDKFTESSAVQEHMKSHRIERFGPTTVQSGDLECEQCGELLPSGRAYFQHFTKQHPDKTRTQYYRLGQQAERTVMCEHCGRVFQRLKNYRDHMNKHTGVKPYKCEFCDKGFTTAMLLSNHRRIHTKEKPYECRLCGMRFANSGGHYNHQKHSHSDERRFTCNVCGKAFKHQTNVDTHVQHVHLKKSYPKRVWTRRKKAYGAEFKTDDELEELM